MIRKIFFAGLIVFIMNAAPTWAVEECREPARPIQKITLEDYQAIVRLVDVQFRHFIRDDPSCENFPKSVYHSLVIEDEDEDRFVISSRTQYACEGDGRFNHAPNCPVYLTCRGWELGDCDTY